MKVKLNTNWATPKGVYKPGDEVDLDDEVAQMMIDKHYAELSESELEVESSGTEVKKEVKVEELPESSEKMESAMDEGGEEKEVDSKPQPRRKKGKK